PRHAQYLAVTQSQFLSPRCRPWRGTQPGGAHAWRAGESRDSRPLDQPGTPDHRFCRRTVSPADGKRQFNEWKREKVFSVRKPGAGNFWYAGSDWGSARDHIADAASGLKDITDRRCCRAESIGAMRTSEEHN